MAITGMHDYAPENGFRVDLLNAVESHDFHWDTLTLADKDSTRTVTLKATVAVESHDYAPADELRQDVLAALDEHGWTLALFQLGDKDDDRVLTVRATRDLSLQQMRIAGT